jgi:catechol 2,3-dioxygenase-like lactoylglutathione lyase family enzyme
MAAAGAMAQPAPRDAGFQKIVQIAIVTKDIEASAKRWAALLGVETPKITTTLPGHEVKVVYRGKPSNGQAKLAFFRAGQVVLELIEPVGKDTAWREHLDKYGEGVHHIGLQVQDLDGSVKQIEALGYPEIHRGRYDKDNGTYVYFDTAKALGLSVELLHSDPPKK